MARIIFHSIPPLWGKARLIDVAELIMGQSPPGSSYNENGEGLPFFQGKAEFGEMSPTAVKWCTEPTRIAEAGDILLSVRAPVGPTNIAKERCCIGRGLASIRGNENIIRRDFLLYYLKFIEPVLSGQAQGSTFDAINKSNLVNLNIVIPTLPEQQRIVDTLKQADELRRLRQENILVISRLRQYLFSQLFGHPEELAKNTFQLGGITHFITSGSRDWSRYYSESDQDAKFIRVQNIKEGKLDFSDIAYVKAPENTEAERARVQPFDVLISITGTIGQVAIVPEDIGEAYISQHVALVRTDQSVPLEFLSEYLNHPAGGQLQIQRADYGQTKPGLNLQQIKSLRIPKMNQDHLRPFLDAIKEIEDIKKFSITNENAFKNLSANLLHSAFTGELTSIWRERNSSVLQKESKQRDKKLGDVKSKIEMLVHASEERPWLDRPARHWLMEQLSDVQGCVYEALREWKSTLIPSEDLDEFRRQCFPIEHLEDGNDQIKRALSELAGLGLIAKITVPNSSGEYVTGYRGLREDELTWAEDLERFDIQ